MTYYLDNKQLPVNTTHYDTNRNDGSLQVTNVATTTTIMTSSFIPQGTILDSGRIDVRAMYYADNPTEDAVAFFIYVNTINSLTNATLLGYISNALPYMNCLMYTSLFFNDDGTAMGGMNNIISVYNLDPFSFPSPITSDLYIIFAVRPDVDVATVYLFGYDIDIIL